MLIILCTDVGICCVALRFFVVARVCVCKAWRAQLTSAVFVQYCVGFYAPALIVLIRIPRLTSRTHARLNHHHHPIRLSLYLSLLGEILFEKFNERAIREFRGLYVACLIFDLPSKPYCLNRTGGWGAICANSWAIAFSELTFFVCAPHVSRSSPLC